MSQERAIRPAQPRWARGAAAFTLVAGLAAVVSALAPVGHHRSPLERVPTAPVRRADLDAVVLAAGRVESSNSTEIRCKLERLTIPGQGGSLTAGGASTILSLIPEGSSVRQGDVLCELDASDYREMVRKQKIAVKRARADYEQAELILDVARIDLRAFREGVQLQTEKQLEGQIALARSDLARQADRLDWLRRMLPKGYCSLFQLRTEEQNHLRTALDLRRMILESRSFRRFSVPKEFVALRGQVSGAEATFLAQSTRLKLEEERLAHYESLVERCTVRAPHDGFVIYANKPGRPPRVYLGAPVRERLRLFYLPDLSRMEVGALLHETVVGRVEVGMPVRVRLEALPGRTLGGRVTSISRLPLFDRKAETATEVTYFLGRIGLTTVPEGLRPGMSAEVEILAAQRRGVLAVPVEAVAEANGREVCYVVRQDHLEQRPVQVGEATHDLQEVTEGLSEGEEVVLEPSLVSPDSPRESDAVAE